MSVISANENWLKTMESDRFYWAVLDVAKLPKRGATNEQFGYLFETVLPVPIESLHAVYVPCGTNEVLACGMDRDALAQVDENALVLQPAALPDFAAEHVHALQSINLLLGEFTPPPLRRLRRRLTITAMIVLAALSSLFFLGFRQRAEGFQEAAAIRDSDRIALIEKELWQGSDAQPATTTLPPDLRLTAALRELQLTRGTGAARNELPDAAVTLAGLLERWPNDLHVEAQQITITPTTLSIQGRVPEATDAQRWTDAFAGMPLWTLQPPRVSTAGREHAEATIQLSRETQP